MKYFLTLLLPLLLLQTVPTHAQLKLEQPNGGKVLLTHDEQLWIKGARGPGHSIAVDGVGNIYVTGYCQDTSDFDSTTLVSRGKTDIFVVKCRPDGSVEWAKRVGGINVEEGTGIGVDKIGNVYVTGSFQDTADFGNITLTGHFNGFVTKYQPDGNVEWAKRVGTNGDLWHNITVDPDGNVYVTGSFLDTSDFDGITLINRGVKDIFVAKYRSNGTIEWVKGAGSIGVGFGTGTSIGVDKIGNVYITGYFQNAMDFDSVSLRDQGIVDLFVAKYHPDGSVEWAKRAGHTSTRACGYGIAIDNAGDIYVTGAFSFRVDFDSITLISKASSYTSNIFVAKYRSDGSVEWAKRTGGSINDQGTDIAVDGAGNSYATGFFSGSADFDGITLTREGTSPHGFVAKYRSDGKIEWVESPNRNGYSNGIVVDSLQNVYVTGGYSIPLISEDTTLKGGHGDIFVWKFNANSVQTDVSEPIPNSILTFGTPHPNPVQDGSADVELEIIESGQTTLQLNDLRGRIVQTFLQGEITPGKRTLHLDLNDIAAGVYFLTLRTPTEQKTIRLIIP